MEKLAHKHLLNLSLNVDFAAMQTIGKTPAGLRRIAPVKGGHFSGERLRGSVLPGADWVINRPDGVMVIDVRLSLITDDHVPIYLNYQGRFLAATEAMERFSGGELLNSGEYSLAIVAKFECGDHRYSWLNNIIAVGTGTQALTGPNYAIFEIG